MRHKVQVSEQDINDELKTISARLPRLIARAQENPLNVSMGAVFNLQLIAISNAVFLQSRKNDIYEHLFYTLQFGLNHLKLAMHPNKPVQLKIGGSIVDTTGIESHDYTGAGTWELLFYLASVLRDEQSLTFLNNVPTDFMKKSNVSFDDIDFTAIEIMKSIRKKNELIAAINKYRLIQSSTKYETVLRSNFDRYLTTPMVNVIEKLNLKNSELFNDELKRALENHYEFYKENRDAYGKPNDPFGWISFKLLAVCTYAYDQGLRIELESDYLPKWLIEGDFKDCKLTLS